MHNTVQSLLIAAAALCLLGLAILAAVMVICGWDFSRLETTGYETNTHRPSEPFRNITVNTDTADIVFLPSEDGQCQVVCFEESKVRHAVSVEGGTLTVRAIDEKHWYDRIGISFRQPKITVYLPGEAYGALCVETDTGNVEISNAFRFETLKVTGSTGGITNLASVSGSLRLKMSTGYIRAENISAGSMELSVSTGDVTLSGIRCPEDISLRVSTGKVRITDTLCQSFQSTGNTGDIHLDRVTAEAGISIVRTTGDVTFDRCGAGEILVETHTGDVRGTLTSQMVFLTKTDTGHVAVPDSITGGRCQITTTTGSIRIETVQ